MVSGGRALLPTKTKLLEGGSWDSIKAQCPGSRLESSTPWVLGGLRLLGLLLALGAGAGLAGGVVAAAVAPGRWQAAWSGSMGWGWGMFRRRPRKMSRGKQGGVEGGRWVFFHGFRLKRAPLKHVALPVASLLAQPPKKRPNPSNKSTPTSSSRGSLAAPSLRPGRRRKLRPFAAREAWGHILHTKTRLLGCWPVRLLG